jgi:hypothetical protein
MANRLPDNALTTIEAIIRAQTGTLTAAQILHALPLAIPSRTLQFRLKRLVSEHRVIMEGTGRWARYRLEAPIYTVESPGEDYIVITLSDAAKAVSDYVRQPVNARKPVGYDRRFLDRYRPNVSFYLSKKVRAHLAAIGKAQAGKQPAGTYVKHILNRLLIDLAWNSSRLEGNTYSLLDTQRLIEFGEVAEGRAQIEAQMIFNHKDAIEFLVNASDDIGFNRYTVFNLHAMLANNLLADPTAAGNLRHIAAGIGRSVFHPLEVPQLIEEAFDQILATAAAITDPYEQAFFVMVQLPYLQPFDDVNKRVSRLAANIPLIQANAAPLSFADVPRQTYLEAMLGVYELNRVDLLRDLFVWAYERSATRYVAVRQSLGEPDPFRLRYRTQLRTLIAEVIRTKTGRRQVTAHVRAWVNDNIDPVDRERFVEITEVELTSLHEGNFARYQVRPSEFAAWFEVWKVK